ncbi:von Willebrand factor type A domain containing protein, putative [Leishmania guyanensis]|uniref:Uncharacterized protein n=1 Tax=Leishmania guyanensis TaxID=5670 RepID=A0A1E1IS45_LEIGU|nr:hypothetical protein, conserved [Leishmania guyanensis]
MDPSAAFSSFPTQERGILLANTYKPLYLHAAEVQVSLSGYAAQVILSLEYVNETNKVVQVIAAYPAPPSYQLQRTMLQGPAREISAHSYEQSRPLRSVEAGSALRAKPLADTGVSAVATQYVPWDVNPGESVLMKAVYHVPISATHRTGEIVFTLPASLIPAVQRLPDVQRAYIKFLDARSRLRHLTQQEGSLCVCVDAQLFVPLRGLVTLEKGTEALPEMCSTGTGVNVYYMGDARFQLTYRGDLPTKAYMQMPLCMRAPVTETSEPLRLHTTVALPPPNPSPSDPTPEIAAAMVVSIAPSLANFPINAEIMFVVDVHSTALGAKAAESVMSAIGSLDGTACLVNVILCRDAHRGGTVSLLPDGSVQPSAVPHESVLAFMKEEGAQTSCSASPRDAAALSPHLPSILHDIITGRGITTSIPDGYVRNIIILSDAGSQPADEDAVAMVYEVANAGRACRVHSVALAATADRAVLEALAEAADGSFASAAASSSEVGESAIDEAVRAAVSAAAVPGMVDLHTEWEVTGGDAAAALCAAPVAAPSPLRMATNADGSSIACIPYGTQRLLYGLLDSANLQLVVRLFGRVGEMRLEYTASAEIQSPLQSDATAAADEKTGTAPSMLMTAAAAARIAYLTHILHAASGDEAHEVMALSQRYTLPSPYTTLTDGNSGPGGEHKMGGVVHLPSRQAATQVELTMRARRVELQAAAALGASRSA